MEEKSNLYLVSIVGFVAIVAIVIMVSGASKAGTRSTATGQAMQVITEDGGTLQYTGGVTPTYTAPTRSRETIYGAKMIAVSCLNQSSYSFTTNVTIGYCATKSEQSTHAEMTCARYGANAVNFRPIITCVVGRNPFLVE